MANIVSVALMLTSVPQSCPPAAFLAPDYLARLAATLVPAGMLVLNLVNTVPWSVTELWCSGV